jgi:hypothetical protein
MTAATRKPLSPGQAVSYRAGFAVITLQATDTGTYTVTTYQGAYRVEPWCRTYPTERQARAAARHTALAFRAHGSDVAIDRRRQELTDLIAEQQRRSARAYPTDRAAVDAAHAEADTLLTLTDLELLDDLRAHLVA